MKLSRFWWWGEEGAMGGGVVRVNLLTKENLLQKYFFRYNNGKFVTKIFFSGKVE